MDDCDKQIGWYWYLPETDPPCEYNIDGTTRVINVNSDKICFMDEKDVMNQKCWAISQLTKSDGTKCLVWSSDMLDAINDGSEGVYSNSYFNHDNVNVYFTS
jgi:hypothetical protein